MPCSYLQAIHLDEQFKNRKGIIWNTRRINKCRRCNQYIINQWRKTISPRLLEISSAFWRSRCLAATSLAFSHAFSTSSTSDAMAGVTYTIVLWYKITNIMRIGVVTAHLSRSAGVDVVYIIKWGRQCKAGKERFSPNQPHSTNI